MKVGMMMKGRGDEFSQNFAMNQAKWKHEIWDDDNDVGKDD